MTTYHNQFLFSEAYLDEITQIEDDSASRASMTSMSEFLIYADHASLSQWNKSFVHECLQSLGFRTEKKSENLALLKQHGEDNSPIGVCISALPSSNLDNTSMGNNYAFEVISALNNSGLKWGIVTNGHIWRIYHTDESTPYENYLEIDLQQILASKDLSSFQLLFFFLKAENFVVKDGQCRFDIFKTESQNKIAYIEDELKKSLKPKDEGGQGVLSDISYGYVEYLRSKGTTDFSDDKIRETIYGGALFYMFRLLFIFYAQARELLHELELQELEFILKKIREHKANNTARKDNFELWHSFNRIFSEINDIYNGGLFNPEENEFTKFIDENRIADCYLSEALYNLLHYTEKNKEIKPISYRDMNVRHLGTLYEGLLEHKLFVAEEDTEVRIVKKVIEFIPQSQGGKIINGKYIYAGQVYFGNDKGTRKASGSYYTPEYIVEYIVTNTVDEKLKELETRFDESITTYKNDLKLALNDSEKQGIGLLIKQDLVAYVENEFLNFNVLDPAMGSGHFLVNATNHISNFITRFMNGYLIAADDVDTGTNLWRRRVVENCIHGVDLSMLASELAKLSLWIMTMAKDKPLSFLNHNLKIGNSLIGARLKDLGKYPFVNSKNEDELLFSQNEDFRTTVTKVINEYELIKGIGSDQKSDILEKQNHIKAIDNLLLPYKNLCDLHTSLYFENNVSEAEYENIISNIILTNNRFHSKWFHWELEFPDQIINKGGFNCIIGNPPWGASLSEIEKKYLSINFKTASKRNGLEGSSNSFSLFIEQGLVISNKATFDLSFILPLSFGTTKSMQQIHKNIIETSNRIELNFFSERPGRVFPQVEQPVTILFAKHENKLKSKEFVSTEFLKFSSGELPKLLKTLEKQSVPEIFVPYGNYPKIGNSISLSILEKVFNQKNSITEFFSFNGVLNDPNSIYYKNTGGRYYKPFTTFFNGLIVNGLEKLSTTQSILKINDFSLVKPINAILNSTTFFWCYQVYSDCWHLNPDDFKFFKVDLEKLTQQDLFQLSFLNDELMKNFQENSKLKTNDRISGKTEYTELYAFEAKPTIDEIDIILSKVYNLNSLELSYLINFR